MNNYETLVQITSGDYENLREKAIEIGKNQNSDSPDLKALVPYDASLITPENFENPDTLKFILDNLEKYLLGIIYFIEKDDDGNYIYDPVDVDYTETRKCWRDIFVNYVEILEDPEK